MSRPLPNSRLPFPTSGLYDSGVTVGIYDDEPHHESEVSSALLVTGSGRQFFEVDSVQTVEADFEGAPADHLTLVRVDTDAEMLKLSNVTILHGNIGFRHAGMTDIQPSIQRPAQAGRPDTDDGIVPKLVTRVESNRGTREEFIDGLENMVSPWGMGDAIIDVQTDSSPNVGYIAGMGGSLSDWLELDKESFGPGGKSVTDIYFDGVAVEHERYNEWLSQVAAEGGYTDD